MFGITAAVVVFAPLACTESSFEPASSSVEVSSLWYLQYRSRAPAAARLRPDDHARLENSMARLEVRAEHGEVRLGGRV